MDISSLLSPQESPVTESTSPELMNPKTVADNLRRSHSTSLTPNSISSPHPASSLTPSTHSRNATSQPQQVLPSPPIISPPALVSSAPSTSPVEGKPTRTPSTAGMDTLADLASMQQHQQTARTSASGLRSAEIYDTRSLPSSPGCPPLQTTPHTLATARASVDLTMTDGLAPPTAPRVFTSAFLANDELETVAQLVTYLAENPHVYQSHVQLVTLLHKGFLAHSRSQESQDGSQDPSKYDLLEDMRKAREAFNTRFPLGEALWVEWLEDELILARSIEDWVALIELFEKACAEEIASVKIWLLYGEGMWSLYQEFSLSQTSALTSHRVWTAEEVAIGQELFGWDTMLEIWKRGCEATRWVLNESNLIWDRYAELLTGDIGSRSDHQKIDRVKGSYTDRLQIPHMTWDNTFQKFSTFITTFETEFSYEATMVDTNARAAKAKSQYASREDFEIKLKRSQESLDSDAEWAVFSDYLEWETTQSRRKIDLTLCNALYERMLLRFGTVADIWDDYILFINERSSQGLNHVPLLPVLARATRHCPWSGSLWAQYILGAEREAKPFHDLEEIKHAATSTGLLDIAGMEDVLKVHTAWCGFLKRRAFHERATDEELDVAEVGIRSALESVKQLGEKLYGKEYKGDPLYRLEMIYVQYLSQSGVWDSAREVWKSLVNLSGDSSEFWLRWYNWEMVCWAKLTEGQRASPAPAQATFVLRQAAKRPNLDWPETVLEAYAHHVEDYEDVDGLQHAMTLIRRSKKMVAKRREKELIAASAAAPAVQPEAGPVASAEEHSSSGKRKREAEESIEGESLLKKGRAEDPMVVDRHIEDQALAPSSLLKRDRENATVIVRNLPPDTQQNRVRQYFRDCGTINTLKLIVEDDGQSATATIEFDSKEDVLSAQTRDMKTFDGNSIDVQIGTGSTLFVTNFPPTADEAYIRDLFKKYGVITDVRFPSLKYNTHRRFCYVQFASSAQASQATELDGKELGPKLRLQAKISDPSAKKDRSGPMYDGREVYVSNVDWSASEEDLGEIFGKYGKVEKVRIPRTMAGKSKGMAFVVFKNKDEASAALELNLTKFKSRLLSVTMSTANPSKRQAITIINDSASPNGRQSSVDTHTPPPDAPSKEELIERTVVLLSIPDTVNDARIRALAEPYGALTKVSLRPDHQGAIVEFKEIGDAGKAALDLEGYEIEPGRKIRIGTLAELKKEKAEYRNDRLSSKAQSGKTTSTHEQPKKAGLGFKPANVNRPSQAATGRRGGRGGLGIKHRAGSPDVNAGKGEKAETNGDAPKARSNEEFRAMFLNKE